MSHPNRQRRRNQTFRLEVLESRVLLSTAGVVYRPAAAVAPLARSAQFTNIAADPEFIGEMSGTFRIVHDQFQFLTSGYVKGKVGGVLAFGHQTTFNGSVGVGEMMRDGRIKYTSGYASIVSDSGANSLQFQVRVAIEGSKFELGGRTESGGGVFAGVKRGTIEGKGSIDRGTGTVYFELTVNVP